MGEAVVDKRHNAKLIAAGLNIVSSSPSVAPSGIGSDDTSGSRELFGGPGSDSALTSGEYKHSSTSARLAAVSGSQVRTASQSVGSVRTVKTASSEGSDAKMKSSFGPGKPLPKRDPFATYNSGPKRK